jgi:hypothetical protein
MGATGWHVARADGQVRALVEALSGAAGAVRPQTEQTREPEDVERRAVRPLRQTQ